MKVLNLYAGIGGNRKLWPKECKVTAIEIHKQIAKVYQDFFPNDIVIVADAHNFLLKHYKEYNFIWSSPPCPTHSRFNFLNNEKVEQGITPKFPDMELYEEVIFLKYWFKGKWVVENVISYYKPLIPPYESGSQSKRTILQYQDKTTTLEERCSPHQLIYQRPSNLHRSCRSHQS